MSKSRITPSQLASYLNEYSTSSKFFIEYGGFLSNHLPHGQIALYHLGDTEDHLRAFTNDYCKRLEVPSGTTSSSQVAEDLSSTESLLGQRKNYYGLLDHYKNLFKSQYNSSLGRMISEEFPRLAPGMLCSALHPLIHTGYGYSVRSATVVCEGLAYLHHSSHSFQFEEPLPDLGTLGRGTTDIVEVLAKLRKDDPLHHYAMEEGAKLTEKYYPIRGFQLYCMALARKGFQLVKYIHSIQVPDGVLVTPEALMNWIVDQAITVYQGSVNVNDFFLIHGVTAAWSLSQLLPVLQDEKLKLELIRTYLCCLLTAYVVQGRPEISVARLLTDAAVDHLSWEQIVQKLLALPTDKTDEHVYKLVQVCRMRSQQMASDGNGQMEDIYKRACMTAMDEELRF